MKNDFYLPKNCYVKMNVRFPDFCRFSIGRLAVLIMFLSAILVSPGSKGQLIQTFDFNSSTYNAVTKGYEQPNVGTYFSKTAGGTITFTTSYTCYGFNQGGPTGSSLFLFQAAKNINSISIKGWSSSNNRTLSSLSTSSTLAGTYTNISQANSSSMTTSNTCGIITVTPSAVIAAGTFMKFTLSGNINVTSIEFDFVPTGTPPSVTTNTVTCGRNTASVSGTVVPGTMPLHSSGIIWSTTATPLDISLPTKTIDAPSATGPFVNTATGLIPSTTYYYRAYVKDLAGNVYYGATLNCSTLPPAVPVVTTTPAFNILSYKASSGGTNIDSGGLSISQKGICWSTSPNPTIASSKTMEGANGNDFTSLMRVLSPCTTYYVRAYAVNALGTGYGNEIQFQTTCPAAPALIANPLSLNFGSIPFNGSSTVFSYTLNGYNLTPVAGNITITPPAGYSLSLSPNSGFTSPLVVPYTGGALSAKTIYVKLATNGYGNFNGVVVHSGGGVTPVNADTVNVKGMIIPDPNVTTNAGTDFWTGFGYQRRMNRKATDASQAQMSLYISVPQGSQAATVNVDLPGIPGAPGFPKTSITITPGVVTEIKGFPTGDANSEFNSTGAPDTRLYYTGVSNRGVHIYSTNGVPVSVWMHTYESSNSAAGTMLFPTNTWNSNYTVQAYGGKAGDVPNIGGFSNSDNPNSFFFVIANEDNTPIWFKPSQDVLDSSSGTLFSDNHNATQVKYQKGVEYGPIYLNKGQVFNAMGFIQGGGQNVANGFDLSGSTVRTSCDRKIAVFGGNGRVLVNGAGCASAAQGSDHLIQQMFPKVAWGTKYITVPTKTMEHNVFRIYIDSLNTKVWVNDPNHTTPLTGLINGLYYQVQGATPYLIESDKPINVTQFIVTGDCAAVLGDKGAGDPEMIILSPVQQAINSATVYSAGIKNSGATYNGHYINVVIRKGGIPSFRLDGLTTADTGRSQVGASTSTCYNTGGTIPIANAFVKLPYDTNYYVAKFKVAPLASHRLYSDSAFNAIAYGMGDGESYGYNAGTNIKDLTKPLFVDNPYFSSNTSNTSCINNPITLKAVLPYPPSQVDSIRWLMGSILGVSPQADYTIHNPTSDSTFITDGVAYFVYKNPVVYTFSSAGSYNITGVVGGTFASQCGSTSPLNFNINIVDPGVADFNIVYNPCIDDTVRLSDASAGNGFPISAWRWKFGDNTTDTVQNPKKVYASHQVYTISLRAINSIGCYADTSRTFDMTSLLIAKFGKKDTLCAATTVVFSDSSSNAGLSGAIQNWYWDYGDGAKDTVHVSSNMNHVYANPGKYYVRLKIETAAGCTANYLDSVIIRANPVADFIPPAGICLPGSTTFTNSTTISDGTIANVTYHWDFGDATSSVATNPSHTYPNVAPPPVGYAVVLVATSQYGCIGVKQVSLTNVFTKPVAAFTVQNKGCVKDSIQFTDGSGGTGQTITSWYWVFGDGSTSTIKNPKYAYSTAGTYNVKLAVESDKGCASDTSSPFSIKINPLPVASFALPSACLSSGSVTFNDGSSITPDDGTQHPFSYLWTFGDPGSGSANTGATQNGQHTYSAPGTYPVILQVTTANGCKASDTLTYSVSGSKPVAGFTVLNSSALCSNKAVNIQNATTIAIGTVTKIEVTWDDINAPGVVETFNNPAPGQVFSHPYPNFQSPVTKSYRIILRAYSGATCFDEIPATITVNASPTTQFLAVPPRCLDDISPITQGSQTSALAGNQFYSGPGITNASTGQYNPALAGPGTHPLQYLFVTTAGCRDSMPGSITVWPAATASFNFADPRCEKNNITFTSTSSPGAGTITSYTWNFGDATPPLTTNASPVVHLYDTAKNYQVTLQIQTSNNCTSQVALQNVTVNYLPKVAFTMPASVCLPDGGAVFTDNSTIKDFTESSFRYSWTFGDGGFSLQKDPLHRYTAVGPFTVMLRVTSGNNCVDSFPMIFNNIHPQPKASFITNPTSGEVCLGDSIRFTSTSDGKDGTVVKWKWDMGDGTADTTATFWHTYTSAKTYPVTLHVFNSLGCVSDTVPGSIIIDGYPVLDAGPDVYMLQGSSVVLNPTVTGAGSTIQYLWTGPYLSNNSVKNPVASPIDDQEYFIKVINGLGCSTEDTMMVKLYRPPVFPNAFSPNGDGINDVWRVTHLNTYSTAKVEVFDRYGRVVFASTGYNKPWDGTVNGKALPVGVYYYVIHLGVVPQPLTGSITLLK